jgi:hypothetical protein
LEPTGSAKPYASSEEIIMATQIWKAEESVRDIMVELIKAHHPDLFLVQDEIALLFRESATKSGGEIILGKSKKASPLFGVLGDTDYKFIIELAADEWQNLTAKQRKALIDHHLCACRCDEDPKSGETKCYLAPADVEMYFDEYDRWGDWRPRPEDEERPISPVEEMFSTANKDADADDTD